MLCQRCKKNPATFRFVADIGGERIESALCAACRAELSGGLSSEYENAVWAELFGSDLKPEKSCPICGTTFADYERTGLLGCPSCYDVFKEELTPVIRRIQGKDVHVGKVGKNNDELGLHRRLQALQERLEAAMREKRFDDAGKLNKRIDDIRKSLYGTDAPDGEN